MIDFGLWIDDPWFLISSPTYWDEARELGITTADVMIDSSTLAWSLRFALEEIETLAKMTRERDIELVVLGWPAPRKTMLDDMLADFRQIARLGVAGLGIDTEHLWSSRYLDGSFSEVEGAAVYLIERLDAIRADNDVRLELTTHPGHREASSRAQLTPFVNRLYLQSYSTRYDWRGDTVAYESRMGPGRRQRDDIARVRSNIMAVETGKVQLCLGQALWDQKWPMREIEEALDDALQAGVKEGVRSFRGWSSKWVLGKLLKNRYQPRVRGWIDGLGLRS